ncbi:MAG: hypothetical protein R8J85_03205 [Mariprofundales bacterium]
MRSAPSRIEQEGHTACYLYGEDHDAMHLSADRILHQNSDETPRYRVDCSELNRIANEWFNPSLFGPSGCIGLVRNAESATPKQSKQLLDMVQTVPQGSRLIICASGAMWKKALHKKLLAIPSLACCEYTIPTPAQFKRWLLDCAQERGINLDQETVEQASERLVGMQQAAQQWLQRLQWYLGQSNRQGAVITWEIASVLLGEHSPTELDTWCHAVASQSPDALLLQRQLIEQQVHPVQMISWLGTRMQQIVLYRWHQSQRSRDPAREAKLFGNARKQVPREAGIWSSQSINTLLSRISEAEQKLKGASTESDYIVLERLVCELIAPSPSN